MVLEFDEALKIIRRKKYNKVILLSNVGPDIERVKQFINDIRAILQFNVVVLFFTQSLEHLNWIKDFPNALFTTMNTHFEEYILNFNKNGLNTLKSKIESQYGMELKQFNADLSYPLFNQANSSNYNDITID